MVYACSSLRIGKEYRSWTVNVKEKVYQAATSLGVERDFRGKSYNVLTASSTLWHYK